MFLEVDLFELRQIIAGRRDSLLVLLGENVVDQVPAAAFHPRAGRARRRPFPEPPGLPARPAFRRRR